MIEDREHRLIVRLAFQFGMSIKQFTETIPFDEWPTWQAFAEMEPFGANEERSRLATIAHYLLLSAMSPIDIHPQKIIPDLYRLAEINSPLYKAKILEAKLLSRTATKDLPTWKDTNQQ